MRTDWLSLLDVRTESFRIIIRSSFWKCILVIALLAHPLHADTVGGTLANMTDTPEDFVAIGSLTSIDTDNPPNGVSGWFTIPRTTNWLIDIRFESGAGGPHFQFNQAGKTLGFDNVKVGIKGPGAPAPALAGNKAGHKIPPAGHGEGVNDLPPQASAGGVPIQFVPQAGGATKSTLSVVIEHAAHFDHYTMVSRILAQRGPAVAPPPAPPVPAFGPPNILTGVVKVGAAHRAKKDFSFPEYLTMLSSPSSGSTVSYNAETKELSFSIGSIDGLDRKGGRTSGIDPDFMEDPVADAKLRVSNLRFESKDPQGRFLFEGGHLTVIDPNCNFTFEASLAQLEITETTSMRPLKSFAMLATINILEKEGKKSSPFLTEFVDVNLLREGIAEKDLLHWISVDFAFVTKQDLVELTSGFTKSVSNIPATFLLTTNSDTDLKF